ncbi:MAG: hypothetical protein ABIE36_01250 [Candidatus Diapherotrites archaeon]
MAKKRSAKKNVEEEGKYMDKSCCHSFISMKLAVVALLLFLLTAWPGLNAILLSVHWGWYLGITVLLIILGCIRHSWCYTK